MPSRIPSERPERLEFRPIWTNAGVISISRTSKARSDHINTKSFDNRLENLRITTQSVQNENRDKVCRHKNAKKLPEEITKELPKFVVYYKEKVSDTSSREFFTVEGHPLQKMKEAKIENSQTLQLTSRRWATTKSNKTSIMDKLEQAILYIDELQKLTHDPTYKMNIIEK